MDEKEEPRTSYVNNIGIAVAVLWLLPGSLFFAIVSGRVEHQDVHNLLWMSYHLILLACMLGGVTFRCNLGHQYLRLCAPRRGIYVYEYHRVRAAPPNDARGGTQPSRVARTAHPRG